MRKHFFKKIFQQPNSNDNKSPKASVIHSISSSKRNLNKIDINAKVRSNSRIQQRFKNE
jgi:hypothetical protein